MRQLMFDGAEKQLKRLEKMGDPFINMNEIIDWEIFRKPLEKALHKPDRGQGGRPPHDAVLMFKIVMLIAWYNLSYNQAEYQINNRLDFMRFLCVEIGTKLPDENSIWDFKEALKKHGLDRELFEIFNSKLQAHGIKVNSGTIVDASFVEVPRRRVINETDLKEPENLTKNEKLNVTLEETETSVLVSANDEKTKHILEQTDFEARYTKKNDVTFFGYKDHAAVDKDTKFIIDYDVTSAEVHDSKVCTQFVNLATPGLWADSAYMSAEMKAKLLEINPDIKIHICNRAYRNKPLTNEQKEENCEISKVRARVEHVFGFMTRSMSGMFLNCIGLERARRDIGLKNLGYNIKRLITLNRQLA